MSDAVEKLGAVPSIVVPPRRRWSEAEKHRIVAESYEPGVSVALVARRNALNANLVFNWRRQFRERGGFVPVVVEPDRMLSPPVDAGAGAVSTFLIAIPLTPPQQPAILGGGLPRSNDPCHFGPSERAKITR